MDRADDIVVIAREMIARYDGKAAEIMDQRAKLNREMGDPEDAAFWERVARAVRTLEAQGPRHAQQD